MDKELDERLAAHADVFGVHLVAFDFLALHGLESAGADVERHFLAVDAAAVEGLKHVAGEMEPGRGSGNGAFYLGIDRLVGGLVALLGGAVQIGRNGQLAHGLEYLGEGDGGVVPLEIHPMAISHHLAAGGLQRQLLAVDAELAAERALLPLLQVANHAKPGTMARQLEHQLVVGGIGRLEEEHLDKRAGVLVEMHAGLDDLGVVEHHQRTLRQ